MSSSEFEDSQEKSEVREFDSFAASASKAP